MQLTGPPRLAGILRGYASEGGPIEDSWEDRSTYLKGRARTIRKGQARLWPSWRFKLVVTGPDWLAWRSDLRGDAAGEFDWSPRTRAEGDPDYLAEHVYRARVRGGLRTLTPVALRDSRTGQQVYSVDVEIEGTQPYEREPDAVSGGYILLNAETLEADGLLALDGYGSGTVTAGDPVDVVIGGVSYPTNYVVLGDDLTRAVRTRQTPDGLAVDTINAPD